MLSRPKIINKHQAATDQTSIKRLVMENGGREQESSTILL